MSEKERTYHAPKPPDEAALTVGDAVSDLPFIIEDRAGIKVLDWSKKGGFGCRPATDEESLMWALLTTAMEKA